MKARTLGFSIGLMMLATAAPLALQACSSDNGTVTTDQDSGSPKTDASTTRADTSTETDSATAADTATGTDSSTPGDDSSTPTGDASDIPDGGEPSTPGTIQCGATSCDVNANTCCFEADASATCAPGATATCSSTAATLHCLEAADCPGGKICCGTFDLSGKATTTCETSCTAAIGAQFCRTNGECKNSQPCYVQKCPKGSQQQQTLELCGHQTLFCD